MPRRSLQRIKFDISQDEILVDNPDFRPIYHPYGDLPDDTLQSFCYSVNEILAEKSRALFERQGRARDVYDVIHISRAFRDAVDVETAVDVLQKKFEFKDLPEPTVASILNRIDEGILEANWSHQLGHQLPVLPNVRDFIDGLFEALVWWIDPPKARPLPSPISTASSERSVQRRAYPKSFARAAMRAQRGKQLRYDTARIEVLMSRIVYAARNQLCLEIIYKGVRRTVEPYSLRYPRTGNTLLYVWENVRESLRTNQIKALSLFDIENVRITDESFRARYRIEL